MKQAKIMVLQNCAHVEAFCALKSPSDQYFSRYDPMIR